MNKIYNTILKSTNSGRTGFYEIGKVIEAGGWEYTIRSAFQPTFPNGAKPTLLICTHEYGNKKTKLSFVVLHKYPNQQYWGYGNVEGSSSYCEQACKGKYGYELNTNRGKYQIVHNFTLNNKRCFVGVYKNYTCGGLIVLWRNEKNGKYYKVMYKE